MQMGDPSSSGSGGVVIFTSDPGSSTSVAGNLCMRSPRQVHHKKYFSDIPGFYKQTIDAC